MAPTNEHAQMANAVKLQVTVGVSEGDVPQPRWFAMDCFVKQGPRCSGLLLELFSSPACAFLLLGPWPFEKFRHHVPLRLVVGCK